MRGSQSNEFAWGNDLRALPEAREMALVAGNQIVGATAIGTLQENIVVRIACDIEALFIKRY
jgi:hypothetical protein